MWPAGNLQINKIDMLEKRIDELKNQLINNKLQLIQNELVINQTPFKDKFNQLQEFLTLWSTQLASGNIEVEVFETMWKEMKTWAVDIEAIATDYYFHY